MKKLNLQLTAPYIPCPFKCPYCVSNFEGEYPFYNLYEIDPILYSKKIIMALLNGDYDGIVLTGMTDPSLSPDWIKLILSNIKFIMDSKMLNNFEPEVVIQTANQKYEAPETAKEIPFFVLAYSIGNREKLKYIKPSSGDHIVRYNMMLSKKFNINDVYELIEKTKGRDQYTVKYLYPTSNGHLETDKWIAENRLELSEEEITELKKIGVWIDTNCMDNEHRYRILREDGLVYKDWYERKY